MALFLLLKKFLKSAFSFLSMLIYMESLSNNQPVKGEVVVNKADIEDRVLKIKAEMESTKANFAKLEGHLAEAMHWLEMINQVAAEFEKTMETEDGGKVDPKNGNEKGSAS